MSNHNSVKWATEEGHTYSTPLSTFANSHNLTNDEFLRGGSGRSHHAGGGNVEGVGTMPTWAVGQQANAPMGSNQEPVQALNTGGDVTFEWKGGSNNKRVMRAEGGSINTSKFTNFLNSLNSK